MTLNKDLKIFVALKKFTFFLTINYTYTLLKIWIIKSRFPYPVLFFNYQLYLYVAKDLDY